MSTATTDVDPARAAKRERILRAAIDVFARTGFFNAKVAEVAREAGVADGTIYLYFQGKEDLLVSIFRESSRKHLEELKGLLASIDEPAEKIRSTIRFHLEQLGNDRSRAIVFQVELRHSLKFMSLFTHLEFGEYLNTIRSIVEDGQMRETFRRDTSAQLVAKSIFGILDEMVTSWILSDKDYRLVEQADAVSDFVLHGLQTSQT